MSSAPAEPLGFEHLLDAGRLAIRVAPLDGLARGHGEELALLHQSVDGHAVVHHCLCDAWVPVADLGDGAEVAPDGGHHLLRGAFALLVDGSGRADDAALVHVDLVGGDGDEGARGEGLAVDVGDERDLSVEEGVFDGERGVQPAAGGVDVEEDRLGTFLRRRAECALDVGRHAQVDDAVDGGDVDGAAAVLPQHSRGKQPEHANDEEYGAKRAPRSVQCWHTRRPLCFLTERRQSPRVPSYYRSSILQRLREGIAQGPELGHLIDADMARCYHWLLLTDALPSCARSWAGAPVIGEFSLGFRKRIEVPGMWP